MQITGMVNDAFVAGIQNGFRLDALLAFVGFVVSFTYIHGKTKTKPSTTIGSADKDKS